MPDEVSLLNNLLVDSGLKMNINIFTTPFDALDFIKAGAEVDCCFLDIIMPEMGGIELAENMRQNGYTGEIVFLSMSKEYGPESYAVKAFSYLLKPPTTESVLKIFDELEHAKNKKDTKSIIVKSGGHTKVILHCNISHVEVLNHRVYFRLTDGSEVISSVTFSEIASQLLLDPRFIQCHRSYIINMQAIEGISASEAIMFGGKRISVARTYKDTRTKFHKWKFGGSGQ